MHARDGAAAGSRSGSETTDDDCLLSSDGCQLESASEVCHCRSTGQLPAPYAHSVLQNTRSTSFHSAQSDSDVSACTIAQGQELLNDERKTEETTVDTGESAGSTRLQTVEALVAGLRDKLHCQEQMLIGIKRMDAAAGLQNAESAARSRALRKEIESRVKFLRAEIAQIDSDCEAMRISNYSDNADVVSKQELGQMSLPDSTMKFGPRSNAERNGLSQSQGLLPNGAQKNANLIEHLTVTRDSRLTRSGVLFRLQLILERIKAEESLQSALQKISRLEPCIVEREPSTGKLPTDAADSGTILKSGSSGTMENMLSAAGSPRHSHRKKRSMPRTLPPENMRWVSTQTEWQLYLCEAKLALLDEALRTFESFLPAEMYATVLGNPLRPSSAISGTLKLRIGDIVLPDEHILHVNQASGNEERRESVYVQVWTDGNCGEPFKVKRKRGREHEEVSVVLNHTRLVEVVIYDKSGRPVAFQVFRPAWLADASLSGSHVFLGGALEADVLLVPEGHMYIYARVIQASSSSIDADDIASIRRQRAMKRRALASMGHNLISYMGTPALLKCAHCRDLVYAGALRCRRCKYTVHRGCAASLHVRCMADAAGFAEWEGLTARLMAAAHSHAFVQSVSRTTPSYCAHCGQIVLGSWLSSESVLRCSDCGLTVHAACEAFVPPLCGLARKDAVRIVRQFRSDQILHASTAVQYQPVDKQASKDLDSGAARNLPAFKESDFVFLSVVGKGNFGKVVLARHVATGAHVALKIVKKAAVTDADEREGLAAERAVFSAVADAPFPFLVQCFGVFQSPTRVFFAMEYVGGGDLMFHIQRQKRFAPIVAQFYAAETLLALEFLHARDIAYRDLKLDNILLGADGHVKLADYGLCKPGMGAAATTTTFCGTTEFMAPEVLRELPYTRAVDWWAFGVLVYELLWARAPFHGRTEREIFAQILNGSVRFPDDPKGSSAAEARIYANGRLLVQSLLQRDPRERLCSAEKVRRHPFFSGLDWSALVHKKVSAPFKPTVRSPADVSNFEVDFTFEDPALSPQPSAVEDPFFDAIVGSFSALTVAS